MSKIEDYLSLFDEKEVVNCFRDLVTAEAPKAYLEGREVDMTDVVLFIEKYCVAFGEDGISRLIADEYNRRVQKYFGGVTDKEARGMVLDKLKDTFFYDGYTMFKGNSIYASAFDWLYENYITLEIELDDEDEDKTILLVLNLKDCTFDVGHFIPSQWYLYNGTLLHLGELAREKVENT